MPPKKKSIKTSQQKSVDSSQQFLPIEATSPSSTDLQHGTRSQADYFPMPGFTGQFTALPKTQQTSPHEVAAVPGLILPMPGFTGQFAALPKTQQTASHEAMAHSDINVQSRPLVRPGITLKHRTPSLPDSTGQADAISLSQTSARLEAVSRTDLIVRPGITMKQRVLSLPEEALPEEALLAEETLQPVPLPTALLQAKREAKRTHKSPLRAILAASLVLVLVAVSIGAYALVGASKTQKAPVVQMKPTTSQSQGMQASATQVSIQPRAMQPKNTNQPTQNTPASGVSPYIFGVNLGLFNTGDQFLNSAATRSLMQQMHVRIIRMPIRTNLSLSVEIQTAQAIKSLGAAPLVILNGLRNANFVANDIAIVQAMNQVFGNSPVYYEFSNEDDLAGITVSQYLNAWNAAIPQVKPLALNGKFVGPVNYHYDRNYLAAFLQGANPQPDIISWHEYTCSYKWAADLCLSHIDNWTNHINDARSTMQTAIGQALPIMITEWNYAPDQLLQGNGLPFPDGKYNNAPFITAWTTKAIQTLAANHIFASMQYSVTNTALPMVAPDSTMTTQGATFQAMYQQLLGG